MLEKILQNQVVKAALPLFAAATITACSSGSQSYTPKTTTPKRTVEWATETETENTEKKEYRLVDHPAMQNQIELELFLDREVLQRKYQIKHKITKDSRGYVVSVRTLDRKLISEEKIVDERVPVEDAIVTIYPDTERSPDDLRLFFGHNTSRAARETDQDGRVAFAYTTPNFESQLEAKRAAMETLEREYHLERIGKIPKRTEDLTWKLKGHIKVRATDQEGNLLKETTIPFRFYRPFPQQTMNHIDKKIEEGLETYLKREINSSTAEVTIEVKDVESMTPIYGANIELELVSSRRPDFTEGQVSFLNKYLKNKTRIRDFLVPQSEINLEFLDNEETAHAGFVKGRTFIPSSYKVRATHPNFEYVDGVVKFKRGKLEKEILMSKRAQKVKFSFGRGKKGQIRDK